MLDCFEMTKEHLAQKLSIENQIEVSLKRFFEIVFCVIDKRDRKWIKKFNVELFRLRQGFAPAKRLKGFKIF